MQGKKIAALTVAAMLCAVICLAALTACNDTASVAGKGVEKPENVFVNDLDTVDGTDLTDGATVSTSSAHESAANLTDGATDTAWTAEGIDGECITITFDTAVTFNTVVLRENGNYITGFRFEAETEDGREEFYRQDRMERYRYCSFEGVTENKLYISIDGVNEGRNISVSEVEVYNLAPKTYEDEFRVFAYYNVGDFRDPALDKAQLTAQLDVVTDIILFEYVYWNAEGELTFTQRDSESADVASTAYLEEAIAYIKSCNPDVRICLDILPGNKAAHGLPECTENLTNNIADLVRELDVDGVEFDWEYPSTPSEWKAYGDMMLALKEKIGEEGRYVSVALSNFNVGFDKEHIEGIDFVQIMGYDRFDPDGNNSSFRSGAYLPMRYFVNLGFKPSRLVAGMPAYGRPDNETVGEYWTNYYHNGGEVWADEDRTQEFTKWDNVQYLTYGGIDMKVYVTGGAMAYDKTAYAIEQDFAGVMVFRNLIDYPMDDDRSVIRAIGEAIDALIAQ